MNKVKQIVTWCIDHKERLIKWHIGDAYKTKYASLRFLWLQISVSIKWNLRLVDIVIFHPSYPLSVPWEILKVRVLMFQFALAVVQKEYWKIM